MLPSSRWIVLLVPLLVASGAAAEDADRCTGTLCDFYYGGPPPEKPASGAAAAPTPVTAPTTGLLGRLFGGGAPQAAPDTAAPGAGAPAPATVPAKRPLVAVQGGGLIGRMNGEQAGRCTGTLCDLYYGGPPPEESAPQPAAMAPGETPESTVDAAPAPARHRRAAEEAESRCASAPGDPWRCYR